MPRNNQQSAWASTAATKPDLRMELVSSAAFVGWVSVPEIICRVTHALMKKGMKKGFFWFFLDLLMFRLCISLAIAIANIFCLVSKIENMSFKTHFLCRQVYLRASCFGEIPFRNSPVHWGGCHQRSCCGVRGVSYSSHY